jgi:TonB-dependent starch-binding outer membrane protein SusC
MNSKYLTVFSIFLLLISSLEAKTQENKSVTGIVTCFKNFPLNKVKITSSKSDEAVYTDSEGKFSVKSFEKDVLYISAEGFENKKIKVGKENTYVIDLQYKDNVTNFNAAVSNGHISEDALRQAINSAKLKNVKDYSHYNSIYELISNEIYSVRVANNVVYNKKVKSFDSNPKVLYVVDDKIVTDISFVNPLYVKSVEFVDDVGATMYGSMGGNGVLKITLK